MEALQASHGYGLEILNQAGHPVAQVPLQANWEPAVESVLFALQQSGQGHRLEGKLTWSIEPVPDPSAGLPYCQGFQVNLEVAGTVAGDRFPSSYFAETAQVLAAGLTGQGRLKAGEEFHYKLLAWPAVAQAVSTNGQACAEHQLSPLPLRVPAENPEGVAQGDLLGPHTPGDIPVDIPSHVLQEADALTRAAEAKECGGVLIGHLVRLESGGGFRVVVTAQIPAEQTESKLTTLVFTPATWAAARQMIRQRGQQDVMIGWWHSHPARHWCSPECPPAKRAECPLLAQFFSAQDREFHKIIYPKAYTIALVVTHTHEGLTHAVYGWRRAQLQERAFHVSNLNP